MNPQSAGGSWIAQKRRVLPDIAPHNRLNFRQVPRNSKPAM
jgi:hypothetical protein